MKITDKIETDIESCVAKVLSDVLFESDITFAEILERVGRYKMLRHYYSNEEFFNKSIMKVKIDFQKKTIGILR